MLEFLPTMFSFYHLHQKGLLRGWGVTLWISKIYGFQGGFHFRAPNLVLTPLERKKIMPSEPIPEYVAYLHPPAIQLSSLLHVCFNALSSGPCSQREGSPGRHEPPPCRHEPPQFARQIGPPPLCSKSLCYAQLPYNSWFLHACNIESSLFFIFDTRILL